MTTRIIAFYLPQFHPIPENDRWWGKGFTEWTSVTQAKPLFAGHFQPRLPADLGFYDLRLPEAREAQADLARQYGIYGFCYHYYWFKNGRRLLERPLDEVLESGSPDFPFCICWANENWTRRWDGLEQDVLIGQEHTPESDLDFLRSVLPMFRDPRYIRVNGRPLLLVYRITLLPDMAATVSRWQAEAERYGEQPPYLVAVESFDVSSAFAAAAGMDATCEFPPHGGAGAILAKEAFSGLQGPFSGMILDYEKLADLFLSRPQAPLRQFKTITLNWDNTARKKWAATVTTRFSPDAYHHWLSEAIQQMQRTAPDEEQIVFINAWNEWAEGTYLEPDQLYGHACLEATQAAILGQPYMAAGLETRPSHEARQEIPPVMRPGETRELPGTGTASDAGRAGGRYKLVVVSMVSNEADIIESFVLENLRFADEMIIACHRPVDGTQAILEELVAAGLPLRIHRIDGLEYNQVDNIRRLVREAVEECGADWVVPLDADEFVDARDRSHLEDALAELGPSHAWVPWINHVPTGMDDAGEYDPLKRIQHRYVYPIPTPEENVFVWKVILRAELIRPYFDRYELAKGAHRLVFRGTNEPCSQPIAKLEGIRLRHFPVRSYEQLTVKVGLGRLGSRLQGGHQATGGVHWDNIWSEISTGRRDIGALQHAVREYLDTGRFTSGQLSDTPISRDPMRVSSSPSGSAAGGAAALAIIKWTELLLDSMAESNGMPRHKGPSWFFSSARGVSRALRYGIP